MRRSYLLTLLLGILGCLAAQAALPDVYLRGGLTGWAAKESYKFSHDDKGNYSLTLNDLDGEFKLGDTTTSFDTFDYGGNAEISGPTRVTLVPVGANLKANNIKGSTVELRFTLNKDNVPGPMEVWVDGVGPGDNPDPDPEPEPDVKPGIGISGTLPVLYINVYTDDSKAKLEPGIISYGLNHKNYFSYGEYWLDTKPNEAVAQYSAEKNWSDIGSADDPLPLEIKGRGNYTLKGFAKKPFKLKLGSKQKLLGMTKSKHYAILNGADDNHGYLRNFVGFNLGKRMGLPWTPDMQPIEVVINGDYRGLYFLTESIRVGDDRVMIEELKDNESDATLCSGGYLVELDNYDEVNQIQMIEKVARNADYVGPDKLRVTYDTPEEYSDVQKQFVTDQFSTMNDLVGSASADLFKYMDLDDAIRYYIVEEIIGHTEAYHGSTYLFRDRGEGQKWHFSPLWDCGNAFADKARNNFFYSRGASLYGNTWIPSLRVNAKFNEKLGSWWKWFMTNVYDGIMNDIDLFANRVAEAAAQDHQRWNGILGSNEPPYEPSYVIDNSDMIQKKAEVKSYLNDKINWLKGQSAFGNFDVNNPSPKPEPDLTEAAPLPDYITDPEIDDGLPKLYLRGTVNSWGVDDAYKFKHTANGLYTLHLESLDGEFKIGDADWGQSWGAVGVTVSESSYITLDTKDRNNIKASDLKNVDLKFRYVNGNVTTLEVWNNGIAPKDNRISGTLPILYINVYNDADHTAYNDEITSSTLDHKNYFTFAECWLDAEPDAAAKALSQRKGWSSVGSEDSPLVLQIKGRGNYTLTGFAKKPFKLKFDMKQQLLGMSKSKHYAILAAADDSYGYMRNFVGFNLGKRMGLPWTPTLQPIEVIMNGDYRGIYFLTESIRVGDDRVPITELNDNETDPTLISGGYLVELDNYDEDNQIRMVEKVAPGANCKGPDVLRVTFDTPEEYSEIQKRFITDQFTAMNDLVGDNSDDLYSYLDLDDAARYYIVEEIIGHTEAYHGSTYLFRDRGEGQKWHFSPLWDCGNAFSNNARKDYFYSRNASLYGNTWIPSLRMNAKFNAKVKESWHWFMNKQYDGLMADIDEFVSMVSAAAIKDKARWHGSSRVSDRATTPNASVADNSDMESKKASVVGFLNDKINWMKNNSDFGAYDTPVDEPTPDDTDAAPLPDYVLDSGSIFEDSYYEPAPEPAEYFDVTGRRVMHPSKGSILIERRGNNVRKVRF